MTTRSTDNLKGRTSVLASLRSLVPARPLRFSESLGVAERQADHLLEHFDIADGPVMDNIVTGLPRLEVVWRPMPTSGLSYWNGRAWVICLNSDEPSTRQCFTLFHEYKHIIDHGSTPQLYDGRDADESRQQAEQAADFFAGCVLVPRRFLERAWASGLQRPAALAHHFDVSERAIQVRLAQVGLSQPIARCAVLPISQRRRGSYYRPKAAFWTLTPSTKEALTA